MTRQNEARRRSRAVFGGDGRGTAVDLAAKLPAPARDSRDVRDGSEARGAMIRVLALEAPDEIDLAAVLALYRNEWWTRDRTLEETRAGLAGSDVVLVAREGDRLVGLARVLSDFVWKALVFDVIVSPAARGRGIGERLIEAMLAHPPLADVRHFELYCLPDMEPFYERFGFCAEVSGVRLMRRPTRSNR